MTSAENQRRAEEEAFEQGFHDIPDPRIRTGMSPEKLAIELSKLERGSPPYILLEHELNLRLAKEQAKATLSAGWLGAGATVLAVFIAAGLGFLVGTSQPKESNDGRRATFPAPSIGPTSSTGIGPGAAASATLSAAPSASEIANTASRTHDEKKKP